LEKQGGNRGEKGMFIFPKKNSKVEVVEVDKDF